MHRTAILLVCILLLIIPSPVSAQASGIDAMQISIWPEYDRPEVLVIYQFTLSADTALPAQVTLHIPASSGGPFNLAYVGTDKNGVSSLFNLDFETVTRDEWLELTFTTPASSLQLEYYDPGLLRDGDSREYVYTWAGDYRVQSMVIQVRQPINAVNLRMEPDLGASGAYENNQFYYTAHIGQVMAGIRFSVKLNYDKPDEILTSGYEQVYTVSNDAIAHQTRFENTLPWVLGSIGILLITIAVVWYLIPNQEDLSLWQRFTSILRREKHKRQARIQPMYCHNCGTRSGEDDQFCRACGTRLRK